MIPGIGVTELIIIGVIAIVLFGSKLPEVARNFGKSYGELRRGLNELQTSIRTEVEDNSTDYATSEAESAIDDYDEPTSPMLEPPPEDD